MTDLAKSGDTVKVHYTGKLNDGKVFDSSKDRDPIEFKIGDGSIINGFEQAVVGMKIGDTKTVKIDSEAAYGPHLPELVSDVEKEYMPPDIQPQLGQQLELKQPDGPAVIVTITDISEEKVTLDANHPLAGKDLTFDIELVSIT